MNQQAAPNDFDFDSKPLAAALDVEVAAKTEGSSTIRPQANSPVLYLVFNKKNQTEAKSKMPTNVESMTRDAFTMKILSKNKFTTKPIKENEWDLLFFVEKYMERFDFLPFGEKLMAKDIEKMIKKFIESVDTLDSGLKADAQAVSKEVKFKM